MEIIIHSMTELFELAELVQLGKMAKSAPVHTIDVHRHTGGHLGAPVTLAEGNQASPLVVSTEPVAVRLADLTGGLDEAAFGADPGVEVGATSHGQTPAVQAGEPVVVDSTGRPWDERIDSSNHGKNADGSWRARRGVSPELRAQILAEWEATKAADPQPDPEPAEDEPVATETHALPKDEPVAAPAAAEATSDALGALIEGSRKAAEDASDSHIELMKACQEFITKHGHAAFKALKGAAVPKEGDAAGKALPEFNPGERRLLQACIANYDVLM